MKRLAAPLAVVLTLLLAAPVAAVAQQPNQKHQSKGSHSGGGSHRGGHAAHPPTTRSAPRAALQRQISRSAPHHVAPHLQTSRSAPRSVPRRASPRVAPRQPSRPATRSAPHSVRHLAAPQRQTSHPTLRSAPRALPNRRETHRATGRQEPQRATTGRRESPSAVRQHERRPQAITGSIPQMQQPSRSEQRAITRQQQRQERALRSREERELRRLPPAQRAVRREEINRAREQRAIQAQPGAVTRPGIAAQRQERAERRAQRRQRTGAVTPLAARNGRFAAPYAANARSADAWRARRYHYPAQRAWHRGVRAAFIPWFGPVFWPYAYTDIFYYVFWPYGYVEGYWAYVYDDFIDGLYWGVAGPPDEYIAYASAPPPRARRATVRQLCQEPGSGITAWPFREIERKLNLDGEQNALLDNVRVAASKAAEIFKASCPAENAYPLTPLGRLRAMTARLQATLEAVETVRPPLEHFYDSLSDEQKARFNSLGPTKLRRNADARAALPEDGEVCAQAKPGLTNLPIEQIDAVVAPDEGQEKLLDKLAEATDKGVSILQAACPNEMPLTPPGRLVAMEGRLRAMIDAATEVRPALDDFYASLFDEQKARFNRLGQRLAKSGE
jgi:hypothetical protein